MIEIWQEYDCPNSGIDFDLVGVDMVDDLEPFYCSGCYSYHIAGVDVIVTANKETE